jgi:excisionase family DNA binding protein
VTSHAQGHTDGGTEGTRPLLVSAVEAAHLLGIGRTTFYEIVKDGDLTPIHIRRCVRFSTFELDEYVERLRSAA